MARSRKSLMNVERLERREVGGWGFPAGDEGPGGSETDFSVDIAKRITENFGIELGTTYKHIRPDGSATQNGFDNLELGLKYKFFQDDVHEAIASVGVDWDIGGTGARRVGAESFSTITPAVFFGKGFGDLPGRGDRNSSFNSRMGF